MGRFGDIILKQIIYSNVCFSMCRSCIGIDVVVADNFRKIYILEHFFVCVFFCFRLLVCLCMLLKFKFVGFFLRFLFFGFPSPSPFFFSVFFGGGVGGGGGG